MIVVRLGAACELHSETPRQRNFDVSEFAVLDDGTEVTLHAERGFGTTGSWQYLTREVLEGDVLGVVLPDDAEETGEKHPWAWLVELLAAQGVQTSVEHLKTLPYEVRLGQSVTERLRP